jgi:uncharacterized ferritin-like protein (DUF455 family)
MIMNGLTCFERILFGGELVDKLTPINLSDIGTASIETVPELPTRSLAIQFSDLQLKFPKPHQLNDPHKKAQALHAFANHELLAIEMMACAILLFAKTHPHQLALMRSIAAALKDEQKHFKLYVHRIEELGHCFGDFPLNNFFWNYMRKASTPESFLAMMSLTFEQANLDFAIFYRDVFLQHGDATTANIMQVVLDDEIKHVAVGSFWLNKWKDNKELFDYYLACLPENLTPNRSKGILINKEVREQAGLDENYINKLISYDDNYKLTQRKSWSSGE